MNPTIEQMAAAVSEIAAQKVELIMGIKEGSWCHPGRQAMADLEWQAVCLLAAHRELVALLRLTSANSNSKRKAAVG